MDGLKRKISKLLGTSVLNDQPVSLFMSPVDAFNSCHFNAGKCFMFPSATSGVASHLVNKWHVVNIPGFLMNFIKRFDFFYFCEEEKGWRATAGEDEQRQRFVPFVRK